MRCLSGVPGVVPAAAVADFDEVLFGVGLDFIVEVLEEFLGAGACGVVGVFLEECIEGDEVAVIEDSFADAFEKDSGSSWWASCVLAGAARSPNSPQW